MMSMNKIKVKSNVIPAFERYEVKRNTDKENVKEVDNASMRIRIIT